MGLLFVFDYSGTVGGDQYYNYNTGLSNLTESSQYQAGNNN